MKKFSKKGAGYLFGLYNYTITFINSSSITNLSGDLNYSIFFNGKIANDTFELIDAGGTINFKEGLIALPSSPVKYTNLTGSMSLVKNDALIKNDNVII